jgi:hypothetical protein
MTVALAILSLTITAWAFGVTSLLSYMVWRMLRSDDWDDSNILNALRLISHTVAHPEDFGKMWYVREVGGGRKVATSQPFWYLGADEFESVVSTRPEK